MAPNLRATITCVARSPSGRRHFFLPGLGLITLHSQCVVARHLIVITQLVAKFDQITGLG